LVVYLRHKSLKDVNRVWHSTRSISSMTGIKQGSICCILSRYKSNGLKLPDASTIQRKQKKASEEVMNFLRDPQTLIDWAPYSLT